MIKIVSALRFHFFLMSKALVKSGEQVELFTVWPKKKVFNEINDTVSVKSYFFLAPLFFIIPKLRKYSFIYLFENYCKNLFSFLVIYFSKKSSLYIFCSTYYFPIRNSKKIQNSIIIVDHGSLHPAFENKALDNEKDIYGFDIQGNSANHLLLDRLNIEFDKCDAIFVYSKLAKNTFVKYGIDSNKIFINYIDFSVDLFDTSPFRNRSFNKTVEKKISLVFVGACVPRKGLHRLLEAMELLDQYQFELVCVGAPPKDAKLINFIDKSRPNVTISLVGRVKENELVKYYKASDFFILPSISDGFGMVTTQAMANKCCCIVSSFAGSSELIDDGVNGFLLSDVTDYATTVNELNRIFKLNEDEYNQIRKNAHNTAKYLIKNNQFGITLKENIKLIESFINKY